MFFLGQCPLSFLQHSLSHRLTASIQYRLSFTYYDLQWTIGKKPRLANIYMGIGIKCHTLGTRAVRNGLSWMDLHPMPLYVCLCQALDSELFLEGNNKHET